MSSPHLPKLLGFLRTIQRPGQSLDSIDPATNLVQAGVIDSLALVQIVMFLEENFGVDFSARGFDPEQLTSIQNLLELIEGNSP